MGVTGLWRLLDPAGKPVPVETLENKILAVDISIWLHQMVKGYRDGKGAAVANAHLTGLFNRLCKLLYYRIKPVFVFDGEFPALKKETIMRRKNAKSDMNNSREKLRKQLLEVLIKQSTVHNIIKEKDLSPKKKSPIKASVLPHDDENLFKLPLAEPLNENESDENEEDDVNIYNDKHIDLHSYDINSEDFKKLTPREKYDLLSELKETRKQNSWGKLDELPAKSDNFSSYQMSRLLKRRQVQVSLEEAEKEIGGRSLSLNELEILLNEEGISTKIENMPTRRIASDDRTHYLLVTDIKETMQNNLNKEAKASTSTSSSETNSDELGKEYDADLQAAINLSLQLNEGSKKNALLVENIEKTVEKIVNSEIGNNLYNANELGKEYDADLIAALNLSLQTNEESKAVDLMSSSESSDEETQKMSNISIVKGFMLENCGLTMHEIDRIIKSNKGSKVNISMNNVTSKQDNQNVVKTPSPQLDSNEVSSSSKQNDDSKLPSTEETSTLSSDTDDDFEEVVDVNVKSEGIPKVELVFNTNLKEEDDIFADIFKCVIPNKSDVPNNTQKKPDNAICTEDKTETQHKEKSKCLEEDKTATDIVPEFFSKEKRITNNITNPKEKLEKPDENKINTITENASLKKKPKESIETLSLSMNENTAHQKESSEPIETLPLRITENAAHQKECEQFVFVDEMTQKQNNKEKIKHAIQPPIDLDMLAEDLETERNNIQKEQNKLDRMGRNITEEMVDDAKDLLKLFGIPYIVAPTEAEAQCAFLEIAGLTHGTITDDSDIWLFGGKTVYKNFFDQQKHVLQFLGENIKKCFKLPREQLILLALLLGSDYTVGISGVGPVTGMEILAAFPSNNSDLQPPYTDLLLGLKQFKSWWKSARTLGHANLRKKLKNITISDDFPNHRIIEAYHMPEIDNSKESFSWGHLDLTGLREFTKKKFGWSQEKVDEILNPVLKKINQKISQQSIRSFFRTEIQHEVANQKISKRVLKAIEQISGAPLEAEEGPSKPKRMRKPKDTKNAGGEILKTDDSPEKNIESVASSPLKNDVVPQKKYHEQKLLKNKIKAIEVFKKSKKVPEFIKKRKARARPPKEEAELSESSGSD